RDYDWRREQLALFSAASIVTLYVGLATHEQAERLADAVRARLLTPGGIMATEYESGEQWDKPNGWAPLQWVAVEGLQNYGQQKIAMEVTWRFLTNVQHTYDSKQKLVEKY
ncbi:alpha,alpha-trehalase TreF, partial [Acinetobacter baumannii]|nr:alpha,alpha-trehalase TreF [Acinetobacter baumannii]